MEAGIKKQCNRCKDELPLSDFYKQKRGKFGVYSVCKPCARIKSKENYVNDKEKQLKKSRLSKVRRDYGLSKEAFEALVYICAICGTEEGRMVIDHDHDTSKFRGVLCHKCNVGIGFLQDDPKLVLSAYNYLQQSKSNFIAEDDLFDSAEGEQ